MKNKTYKYRHNGGMSLVEILVVVAVFGILGSITTTSVMLTLRGARKSESQQLVRENLNYALSVIERQIRGAEEIISCSGNTVSYKSGDNITSSFTCTSVGVGGYMASGSARLTSDDVSLTACSFSCTQTDPNQPYTVSVSLTGKSKATSGVESSTVTTGTDITLRNN